MIYVTHDQVEAMTVGQRIAVLHDGSLQQIAAPREIYDNPANTFVASFIGSPAMNLLDAKVDGPRLVIDGMPITLPNGLERFLGSGSVIVGIRPENIRLVSDADAILKGQCQYTENTGNLQTIFLHLPNGSHVFVQTSGEHYDVQVGETVGLSFVWDDVRFFSDETGENLYVREKGGIAHAAH